MHVHLSTQSKSVLGQTAGMEVGTASLQAWASQEVLDLKRALPPLAHNSGQHALASRNPTNRRDCRLAEVARLQHCVFVDLGGNDDVALLHLAILLRHVQRRTDVERKGDLALLNFQASSQQGDETGQQSTGLH